METTKETKGEDKKETSKKVKKDTKLIPTEELAATNSSSKENEKLSVFYKKDTIEPEAGLSAETSAPSYSEPQHSAPDNTSSGQSNFFSTLISFFAIIISVAAIFIVKSGVPQVKNNNQHVTAPSHIDTQIRSIAPSHPVIETNNIDTQNSFLLLEREVDQLKFELLKENKLRLEREIDVIEYLSKKSKGKIRNQLESLSNDLSLLTQEFDK